MNETPRILTLGLLAAAAFLTGCASERERMLQQGYPPAYAAGFEDGCHSGKKAGGSLFDQFRKDIRRFESDSRYAQGWSDGFRECESEEEAMLRRNRVAIERQRLIEQRQHDHRMEKTYRRLRHPKSREQKILDDAAKDIDTKALEKSLKDKYP